VALAAAVFVLVFSIVAGAFWVFVLRPEQAADSALRKRMRVGGAGPGMLSKGVQREAERLSTLPALNRLLSSRAAIAAPIHGLIEQAGIKTTVGSVVLGTATLAMGGFVVGRWWLRSVAFGAVGGALLGAAPYLFLRWKRAQRIQRFEELFPEALTLMTRAMRAGHTFVTAIGMVADEMPQPIAAEFKLLHDRQNFGLPLNDALRDFGQRVPVLPAKFFATAVLTQRESGGNLTEVLDNLASVIRDRFNVMRQVRTKSAHGRMTGWILVGLPPAAAAGLSLLNPGHFADMLNEPFGVQLIVAAVVLQTLGALVIRKIVNVEY
jgi:tight adherence protein B